MPKTSFEDRLAAIIEDLTHILKNPHPKQPFLEQGKPTNDAIRKLKEMFHPSQEDTAASQRVPETETTQPKRIERRTVPRMPEKGEIIKKAIVEPKKHPSGTILLQKFGGRIH